MSKLDFPGQDAPNIELKPEQEAKLVNYLCKEITSALSNR